MLTKHRTNDILEIEFIMRCWLVNYLQLKIHYIASIKEWSKHKNSAEAIYSPVRKCSQTLQLIGKFLLLIKFTIK